MTQLRALDHLFCYDNLKDLVYLTDIWISSEFGQIYPTLTLI